MLDLRIKLIKLSFISFPDLNSRCRQMYGQYPVYTRKPEQQRYSPLSSPQGSNRYYYYPGTSRERYSPPPTRPYVDVNRYAQYGNSPLGSPSASISTHVHNGTTYYSNYSSPSTSPHSLPPDIVLPSRSSSVEICDPKNPESPKIIIQSKPSNFDNVKQSEPSRPYMVFKDENGDEYARGIYGYQLKKTPSEKKHNINSFMEIDTFNGCKTITVTSMSHCTLDEYNSHMFNYGRELVNITNKYELCHILHITRSTIVIIRTFYLGSSVGVKIYNGRQLLDGTYIKDLDIY